MSEPATNDEGLGCLIAAVGVILAIVLVVLCWPIIVTLLCWGVVIAAGIGCWSLAQGCQNDVAKMMGGNTNDPR